MGWIIYNTLTLALSTISQKENTLLWATEKKMLLCLFTVGNKSLTLHAQGLKIKDMNTINANKKWIAENQMNTNQRWYFLFTSW